MGGEVVKGVMGGLDWFQVDSFPGQLTGLILEQCVRTGQMRLLTDWLVLQQPGIGSLLLR